MALNRTVLRNVLENDCGGAVQSDGRRNTGGFSCRLLEMLGLGKVVVSDNGRPRLERYWSKELHRNTLESDKAILKPEDVNISEIGHALFGTNGEQELWEAMCRSREGYSPVMRHNLTDTLEAVTDILPSQFSNISAWNATTAGLFEAKVLEVWQRPEFIGEKVCPTVASVRRAEKIVGVSMIGDIVEERKPGNAHARAPLSERYVTTPITQNKGLGVDVTREAVMFDWSKELLSQAESITLALGMRVEKLKLDTVLGVTNSYTYGGINYNTYVASGGNYVNKLAGSTTALVDWTQLNALEQLFVGMTDQETGQPISVQARQLLVMPTKVPTTEQILGWDTLATLTNSLAQRGYGNNIYKGRYELLPTTAFVRNEMINGLSLTGAQADLYYYLGDFKKAFAYFQQLPLTPIRTDANNYEMADRGLVFSMFLDEMGIPGVLEPRYVVQCTGQT